MARAPVTQAEFTSIASVAGLPALALPAGVDADHLPVSVQLVGPAGSETRLIALARRIEATIDGYAPPRS
ncbi:amidase family protein [Sphingomonas sp.]|uniref:amidase family protein n=1 Tax=Sphingomonas sp. TaxID=28214 RepID=UPI0035A90EAF